MPSWLLSTCLLSRVALATATSTVLWPAFWSQSKQGSRLDSDYSILVARTTTIIEREYECSKCEEVGTPENEGGRIERQSCRTRRKERERERCLTAEGAGRRGTLSADKVRRLGQHQHFLHPSASRPAIFILPSSIPRYFITHITHPTQLIHASFLA